MTSQGRSAPEAKEPIDWFHDNLELLVEDVHLGEQVDLCFDTEDFAAVILGMYEYYDAEKNIFRWEKFRNEGETVLVYCLAAAGWLGKLTLLPPHRAEFMGLLRRDFGLAGVIEPPLNLARRFLATGFNEIAPATLSSGDLDDLRELEGERLVESFGGKAELAKEFFKLLQCIKGSWRTRLIEWDRYLSLHVNESFDPTPYLKEEVFLRVKRALDRKRSFLTMNNFSDALAVAILAVRVREFEEDPKHRRLPIFFDHAGDLQQAIRSAGVSDALRYRRAGKEFSVLRDWRYFFLRATFGHRGKDPHSESDLKDLLHITREIKASQQSMAKETVRALGNAGRKIDQLIEYMEEFSFFGNVWLPSWRDDLERVIDELSRAKLLDDALLDTVEELQSDEIRQKFKEARETVEQSFKRSAEVYQGVRELLRVIDNRVRSMRRELVESGREESDIVLILGLFRFPFPPKAQKDIAGLLIDLAKRNADRRADAQMEVFSALSNAKMGAWLSDTTLTILLGVLWAAELDNEILDLSEGQNAFQIDSRFGEVSRLSVLCSLILMAAFLRTNFGGNEKRYMWGGDHDALDENQSKLGAAPDEIRRALARLEVIESIYEGMAREEKIQVSVSLAYIEFHIFVSLFPERSSLWPDGIPGRAPRAFLDKAISCASLAWEADDLDEKLRLYALNQLLYYLSEGVRRKAAAFDGWEENLNKVASQLLHYEGGPGWHYRYDDSISRYYALVGQERDDPEAWSKGLKYIQKALGSCFGDPLIKDYFHKFNREYESWRNRS
jgi:hypothetical protein